jgi:poly(3-hydroxybutyrate) depolymerase
MQPGVGHYGVFNGSRFRAEIAPRIADFVLSNNGEGGHARMRAAPNASPAPSKPNGSMSASANAAPVPLDTAKVSAVNE